MRAARAQRQARAAFTRLACLASCLLTSWSSSASRWRSRSRCRTSSPRTCRCSCSTARSFASRASFDAAEVKLSAKARRQSVPRWPSVRGPPGGAPLGAGRGAGASCASAPPGASDDGCCASSAALLAWPVRV